MAKPKVTRTFGPLHFEDLDPHRFEDLVRELIYDFKDWQTLEATGLSGSDGGFDARAYEKNYKNSGQVNDEEEVDQQHPMDGNLWMIQCKREKSIGPKRIKDILKDVDQKNPPHGYILAASSIFSKDSYDSFREELKKKGVMEFYLWGKLELEDMLHLPKNDRILFTFFGISLVSRKRSRATEIRQSIITKNKLFRVLGDPINKQPVLFRDSQDTHYPYKKEYKDFKDKPRWREYEAVGYHPLGLIVSSRIFFGYIDVIKKEYDFTEVTNLLYRRSDSDEEREEQIGIQKNVEAYWDYLPRSNQGKFYVESLVPYEDMLVVDEKGDGLYKFPHIFVDFGTRGPLKGNHSYMERSGVYFPLDSYKKINKFPPTFIGSKVGKIHDSRPITLDPTIYRQLDNNERFNTLFAIDNKYKYLKKGDFVPVKNLGSGSKYYLQITHTASLIVKDYLKEGVKLEWEIEQQIGRKLDSEDRINIYEFKIIYDFVLDGLKKEAVVNPKKTKSIKAT